MLKIIMMILFLHQSLLFAQAYQLKIINRQDSVSTIHISNIRKIIFNDQSFNVFMDNDSLISQEIDTIYRVEYQKIRNQQIKIDSTVFDFDTVLVNQLSVREFKVSNLGGLELEVDTLIACPGFKLRQDGDSIWQDTLPGFPVSAYQYKKIQIAFIPRIEKFYQGEIEIRSNDPGNLSQTIKLCGFAYNDRFCRIEGLIYNKQEPAPHFIFHAFNRLGSQCGSDTTDPSGYYSIRIFGDNLQTPDTVEGCKEMESISFRSDEENKPPLILETDQKILWIADTVYSNVNIFFDVETAIDEADLFDNNYQFRCFPNPFNPNITIRFFLVNTSRIHLSVYNILGEHLRTIFEGNMPSGDQKMTWNGKGEGQTRLPNGIYIIELKINQDTLTQKVSLIK